MPPADGFADQMLIKFLDTTFVDDLLDTQLGLDSMFNLTYAAEDLDLKSLVLDAVERRQFATPAFETIRTTGIDEKIQPSERVQVSRLQPRLGRLAWVDVFLRIRVAASVQSTVSPIDSITVTGLIEELGGVSSVAELRTKLEARYTKSIVDAFFQAMRITSLEDFTRRGNLYVKFTYKAPLPFVPSDPANARLFRMNLCVRFQGNLNIAEALQGAKLCRSILENDRNFVERYEGGEVKTPYVFIVLFPDSAAVDNAIGTLPAAQIKTEIKALFDAEGMLSHFVAGT